MSKEQKYRIKNLSSNLTGISTYQDLQLVNAWGLARTSDTLWVADHGTGILTSYDFTGNKLSPQNVVLPVPVNMAPSPSPTYIQTQQLLARLNTPMLPPQTGTLYTAIGLPLTNTLLCFNKTQAGQYAFLNQTSYPSSFQEAFGPAYTNAFAQDLSQGPTGQLRLSMQNLETTITRLHQGGSDDVLDPSPTGIIINDTRGFVVGQEPGGPIASSQVIVAADDGVIYGYSPLVSTTASLQVNNTALSSVYKGLALLKHKLYVADFYNNRIDVFDSDWQPVLGLPFIDEDKCDPIPPDYAPFNIVAIRNRLYVLYAKQQPPNNFGTISWKGHGFISVFKSDGTFVKRLVSRGELNSPWGLTIAPEDFGQFSGQLLVGNNGDGRINAYTFKGKHLGTLKDKCDKDIVIDGLYGLATHQHALFCSSSPTKRTNGLLSRITLFHASSPHKKSPCKSKSPCKNKSPCKGK